MLPTVRCFRRNFSFLAPARSGVAILPGALVLALSLVLSLAPGLSASAQDAVQPQAQPQAQPDAAQPQAAPPTAEAPAQPAAQPAQATPPPSTPAAAGATTADDQSGGITEEELTQMLVGKEFFLRGGYQDDSLSFNEHGQLIGNSPKGSFTMSGVVIDKVRLTKRRVDLEGARYGLHFLGELPYEVDPTKAADRVRVTPKKKKIRISIDREDLVKPKTDKELEKEKEKAKGQQGTAPPAEGSVADQQPAGNAADEKKPETETNENTPKKESGVTWIWHRHAKSEPAEGSEADQSATGNAAAPANEKPGDEKAADETSADAKSVTQTTSPAHATMVLKQALDNIFAPGLDDRMMAAMPGYWKFYFEAAAAKTDYRPSDPAVLRQSDVDRKAKLLTMTDPDSNQYAQDNGVAGLALYHVVVGADGKPGEIAVARPIGFGLDENAVGAIRKATFEPAIKDGKPVPVVLDLRVEFRIYSKLTDTPAPPGSQSTPTGPALPGPYSAQH